MQNEFPYLFVEINNFHYSFFAGKYDENQNFIIIERLIVPSAGLEKNKLINLNEASEIIKKNFDTI
jgi:hypothetical protein